MAVVVIGIDIGQKRDPTAIAVAEIDWRPPGNPPAQHFVIRHLERLPLGTPYPEVSSRLAEIVANLHRKAAEGHRERCWGMLPDDPRRAVPRASISVYVDATGVGQPVVDLLNAAGVVVNPVYFTHGDRRSEEQQALPLKGVSVSLGKAWLVSRLQALLQTGRIHLPETNESRVLAKELQDYEIKVSEDANDKYGAFKVGTHDDLVTALGLAVQGPPRVNHPLAIPMMQSNYLEGTTRY